MGDSTAARCSPAPWLAGPPQFYELTCLDCGKAFVGVRADDDRCDLCSIAANTCTNCERVGPGCGPLCGSCSGVTLPEPFEPSEPVGLGPWTPAAADALDSSDVGPDAPLDDAAVDRLLTLHDAACYLDPRVQEG